MTGGAMARKTIFVSDISGKPIPEERDGATVVITFNDARRGVVRLDVLASEVEDLTSKGTKQARRGRKPGTQKASGQTDSAVNKLRGT
jgi:hypothetical protein